MTMKTDFTYPPPPPTRPGQVTITGRQKAALSLRFYLLFFVMYYINEPSPTPPSPKNVMWCSSNEATFIAALFASCSILW